jgi:nucleoid-associated protein EbfC
MFDKIKGLMDMQKKMQDIKRQLDALTFEVISGDGQVSITMNGAQEIKNVIIQPAALTGKPEVLARTFKDTFNKAIKRSHEEAAGKMKDMTGLNLPGL